MRRAIGAAALLVLVTSIPAYARSADDVYNQALTLKSRGMFAMFSGDTKALISEFQTAARDAKAENEGAKARGAPLYCPSQGAHLNSDDVMAGLGRIPVEQRRKMTLVAAWKQILVQRFPCH